MIAFEKCVRIGGAPGIALILSLMASLPALSQEKNGDTNQPRAEETPARKQAIAELKKFTELSRDFSSTVSDTTAIKAEKNRLLEKALEGLVATDPTFADAYAARGRYLHLSSGTFNPRAALRLMKAADDLATAVELAPDRSDFRLQQVELEVFRNEPALAQKYAAQGYHLRKAELPKGHPPDEFAMLFAYHAKLWDELTALIRSLETAPDPKGSEAFSRRELVLKFVALAEKAKDADRAKRLAHEGHLSLKNLKIKGSDFNEMVAAARLAFAAELWDEAIALSFAVDKALAVVAEEPVVGDDSSGGVILDPSIGRSMARIRGLSLLVSKGEIAAREALGTDYAGEAEIAAYGARNPEVKFARDVRKAESLLEKVGANSADGERKELQDLCEALVAANPKSHDGYRLRGIARYRVLNDIEAGKADLLKAFDLAPLNYGTSKWALLHFYVDVGDLASAKALASKDYSSLDHLADYLAARGHAAEAKDARDTAYTVLWADRANRRQPDDELLKLALRRERWADVVEVSSKAIEAMVVFDPKERYATYRTYLRYRIFGLHVLGRTDEAEAALKEGQQRYPGGQFVHESELLEYKAANPKISKADALAVSAAEAKWTFDPLSVDGVIRTYDNLIRHHADVAAFYLRRAEARWFYRKHLLERNPNSPALLAHPSQEILADCQKALDLGLKDGAAERLRDEVKRYDALNPNPPPAQPQPAQPQPAQPQPARPQSLPPSTEPETKKLTAEEIRQAASDAAQRASSAASSATSEQEFKQAVQELEKLAENEGRVACYFLGNIFQADGKFHRADHEAAIRWWRKGAEMGHVWSQFNLGLAYFEGRLTEKNLKLAEFWLEASAKQGGDLAEAPLKKVRQELQKAGGDTSNDKPASLQPAGK